MLLFTYFFCAEKYGINIFESFQIAGIKPKNGGEVWSREGQAAVCNVLTGADHIEVEPVSDWELFGDPGCTVVPFATVKIFADGNNVGQMIVEQGYAQCTQ